MVVDQVTSSLIGRVIEGYFSIFFKNFRKEDFKLNLGANETTSTLHNLELNNDVVQELIGIPNFLVKSVTINSLEVKIRITNIKKSPIIVLIDRIDCILEEPFTKLKPLPTVLEDFFKKLLPNSGKSSYGFVEKTIDGVTIEIKQIRTQIITRGRYKTEQRGEWTPPVLICDIEGVSAVATNEKWEVVDLKTIRQFNEKKENVFIFKVITISKFSCGVSENNVYTPIITNLPFNIYVTIKKTNDNMIKGISAEIKINNFQLSLKMQNILHFVRLVDGISCCMDRRDIQVAPAKIPHPSLTLCVILRDMSITLFEEQSGRGLELCGENIQFGMNWPEDTPSYEKFIEFCVPMIRLREYSTRSGPDSTSLMQPDYSKPFKNPFTSIKGLSKTLHPHINPYILDREPLFYMRATNRNPPHRPLFDKEIVALLNPILMIVRQESIQRLLELVASCSPFLQQIQDFQSLKPNIDLKDIIIQETRNPLEDLLSLKFDIGGVTLMFPSSTGKYANISFHLLESQLLSHPKLPESDVFSSGIATLTSFPGDAEDFVHKREQTRSTASHFVKFKVLSRFAITLQSELSDEALLEVPNIGIDFAVFVGNSDNNNNNANAENSEVFKNTAMQIQLLQGSLNVDILKGKLTQIQYKTLLNRAYMLLPIFPLLQKIQSSFKAVEKPETPLIFLFKMNKAEWLLLDDSNQSDSNQAPVPLASMSIENLQCLVENTSLSKVAKVILQTFNINALPAVEYNTTLYNPNAFVSTNPNEPLIVMRVKKAIHPPGELLKKEENQNSEDEKGYLSKAAGFLKNMSYNRAFHVGDRSKVDIRISGFRSGVNPNPACKILTFFLKSELNVKRILATLDQAKNSLEIAEAIKSVDIVELTDNIVIDIDFFLHIKDSQFYFVRDREVGLENLNGNIGFIVEDFILDRHTEGKYIKKTKFLLNNVSLICNKEESETVTPIYVFKPVSFHYNSKREWDLNNLYWVIESEGGMEKFDIAVNASHSGVFMNVVNGVKMQNIQDVVDCITAYVNQDVGTDPIVPIQSLSISTPVINPFTEQLSQLSDTLNGLEDKLTFAAKEKATIAENLKQLQMKSNVLAFSTKSGFINNLEGRAFTKRYAVLSNNSFFLFESEKCLQQLCQVPITSQTALELVQNIPNTFQMVVGQQRLIIQLQDEVEMSQWVNEILKMQVGGETIIQSNDGISQCKESIKEARTTIVTLSSLVDELSEKTNLLARIKALETELRQKNEQIAKLQK